MKYRATLRDKAGTWYGYGKTDHAAVMDAVTLYPDTDKTQCALSIWQVYDNDVILVWCSTLSWYFEETK
jgi:hypothetical protein